MKNRKLIKSVLTLVVFAALCGSCEKFLEVAPQDLLTTEQHFRDKFDADAAVRGIYG